MGTIKRLSHVFLFLIAGLVNMTDAYCAGYEGKKVLYINSYHNGYEWSDGITQGIEKVFKDKGIILTSVEMDTKRNGEEDFKKEAGLRVKKSIEEVKPDLVIAADDNAFKYVIMPYYKNADLPVVFCGLNWDASAYGAPYDNTTGMIEVALVEPLLNHIKPYMSGNRIGFIGGNVLSARKEAENYKKVFDLSLDERYVKNIDEWKAQFLNLQKKVDMIIIFNNAGIKGWKDVEMKRFLEEKTTVPTGSSLEHMAPYCLMVLGRIASEQGEWAANAALKILDGKAVNEIPLVKNKKATIYIKMKIAKKLNIRFPMELIERATFVQ